MYTIRLICRRKWLTNSFREWKAIDTRNLTAVHENWKDCVNYYSMSLITLRKFIRAFSRLRVLRFIYKALEQMVAAASHHKCNTTRSYEEKLCISKLVVPITSTNDVARDRYMRSNHIYVPYTPVYSKENVTNKGVRFGTEAVVDAGISSSQQLFSRHVRNLLMGSFGDIISACAYSRNFMLAEQLMLQMRILGLEPSTHTYNGYVRALLSLKSFRDGMELLNVMQQENMKPSDSTLAALSTSCSRSLQLDLAETFLYQVSKGSIDVIVSNEFLRACDYVDKPEQTIIRAWARMKDKNLKGDIITYALLFSLFGCVSAGYDTPTIKSQAEVVKRINVIEMDMTKNGIQHDLHSMRNLLHPLGREKMITELIKYVRMAEEKCKYSSTNLGILIYNLFLHSLVKAKAKECETAFEIYKKMISSGLSPDKYTYGIMLDCCTIIMCYKSADVLISRMIRDGCLINAVHYACLLKTVANRAGFDEAFRVLNLSSLDAIQPNVLVYNGRIDVIELIIEKMHRMKIRPDASTCHHVFTAYTATGFHSTDMEALQVMSMRMISEDDRVLEKYRLKYENLILDEENNSEFEITEIFTESPEFVAALLNLRWFAILVSPPSWSPDQAKMISSNCWLMHRDVLMTDNYSSLTLVHATAGYW